MPLQDYAIVVGIGSYPAFGPGGTPLDLKSPVAEAQAVADWLGDPAGGALPAANIQLITSTAAPAGDPEPTRDRLEAAMIALDDVARAQLDANRGVLIGRRLYIYMSGHGFSPARQKGCLFVANARERQSYNIYASAWLEWFQEAGYFREFVLWMDCCMDRFSFIVPGEPTLPRTAGQSVPGPTFVAFAAQRPLKAAEVADGGGTVRGAFTWALLDGLRGAATDANARVTGRSLADWLRQSILGRLPPAALGDPDVAKEPDIVSEDAELIFARGMKPLLFDVTLQVPDLPDDQKIVLWSGVPLRPETEAGVIGGVAVVKLTPGLYHAEAPDTGLAASFEVVTDRQVALEHNQQPVQAHARDDLFTFDFNPPTPTVEIAVIDRRFAPIERSVGQISTRLPAGVFKLRTRSGRTVEDTVLLLDRDRGQLAEEIAVSASVTVAPIAGAAAAPAASVEAAAAFVRVAADARSEAPAAQSSSITLMARSVRTLDGVAEASAPWQGLSVVDAAGDTVLALEQGEIHREDAEAPFAIHAAAVTPGSYFLRLVLDDGTPVEQSLIVPDGWSLDTYVLRRIGSDGKVDFRPRISVQMSRNDKPCPEEVRSLVETARTALADERPILSSELEDLLLRKFCNPMAGILGGHLLLLGQETGQTFDPALFDQAVTRLRALVGTEHPDVEALSLRCTDPALRRRTQVRAVPMLTRSWQLLTEASYSQPYLLGVAVFRRLVAQTAFPPFLVWSIDPEMQRTAMSTLVEATLGTRTRSEVVRDYAATVEIVDGAAPLEAILPAAVAASVAPHARTASLDLASRADRRLVRQRAASLKLPAAAVKELFGALQDA
jgi:hypothetical protein